MKSCALLLIMVTVAMSAPGALGAEDEVTLKNGSVTKGKIVSLANGNLAVDVMASFGTVKSSVPLATVQTVRLGDDDALRKLIAPGSTPSLEALKNAWQRLDPLLVVPGTPGPAVGVVLAKKLLDARDAEAAKQAGTILTKIRNQTHDEPSRRAATELLTLVAVEQGNANTLRPELEAAARSEDPSVSGPAAFALARLLVADYQTFVEDNPRWEIDPEAKKQRDALFHSIVDHLLRPALEYGFSEELAARCRWELVLFLQSVGLRADAEATATDLVALFPDSRHSQDAKNLLTTLKTP
jgi:hypothetical protein